MAAHDKLLAEKILEAFRLAYLERRLGVAEHLLRALERLENDGCRCGCRGKAYALICRDDDRSVESGRDIG